MRHFFLFYLLSAVSLVFGQTGYFYPSERFSSGLINDVCQDKHGYIWIATENGLNKFDGYRFTTYQHQLDDATTLNSNIVVKLYSDNKGRLWVGTRMGLSCYDEGSDRFVNYPFPNQESPRVISMMERQNGDFLVGTSGRGLYKLDGDSLQKVPGGFTSGGGNWYFNQMMEDSKGRFWKCGYGEEVTYMEQGEVHQLYVQKGIVVKIAEVGGVILIICQHGIYSFNNGELSLAGIDMSALADENVVLCSAYQDRDDNIFIGTRGDGLFRLSKGSQKLERVECSMQGVDLRTAKIMSIHQDRLGNMWLGCQSKGLVMLPSSQPQFSSWSFSAQHISIGSTITSICEGSQGMTWCTVQGNGVYGFDGRGRIVAHPSAPPAAEFIYRDKRNQYWIGTDEALYSYDPLTGRTQRHISLVCDKVNYMIDDAEGNLYISTYSRGFCVYNMDNHSVRKYLSTDRDPVHGNLWNNWVLAMMFDRNGRLWLATSAGVCCYEPKTENFHSYGWESLLDGMMCYSLCETHDGDVLIGTDQGLYRYKSGTTVAEPFAEDGGLSDKVIGYMVEAANGDIWCSTSMGIWQYDVKKKKFIGHVSGNGLTAREYVNCVGMHCPDDQVIFANNDGLTVFLPSKVTGSHKELPDVKVTGFFVAGNTVNKLSEDNRYRVSYLDNGISLEFSLLDFNNPSSIVYEYRINDGKWTQVPEGQNSILLSHLPSGNCEIEVRALSAGVYSKPTLITIMVTPPWYQSTWAYLIYILVLIGIVVWMGLMWRRRTNRQLAEEKMKFLINATHDIRSPLTLIMGPLEKLKNSKIEELKTTEELQSFNSSVLKPSIETIDRNAQRLMHLVNQILDERRIDKQQMQLHCRETNLVEFISGICKLYQFGATQRNITFSFEHDKDHVLTWIDRINFDKVISNLLSNAFKYTFDGGEIKVVLRDNEKVAEIQVIDSGVGIKDENPERLFDRFYQGRNSADLGMQGTGIGLNLCRAITEMHGGQIKAAQRVDGHQGACFTVTIPRGNRHLKPEQIVIDAPAREVLSTASNSRTNRQFRILVVDDDKEIAGYIISELGNRYKFDHAPNGKEALKMLLTSNNQKQIYDLVISDVMMPEMDGLTLLKRIKENPQISQLPVIMLTSKVEVEHKLEGLKSGADAYIAKPFNMEELHIQIDNLIDNVRRLRGKFSGAVTQEERVENIEVKGYDDALMERVMRSVNANMSNPNFNVDMLANDVGISRAQLHRRMKEITGLSSGKFLRNLRMEQAARLLREGTVNVSQVADLVGYADQAHFSTAFKAHFGQSPTEYADTHSSSNHEE
jgi:signal transduction histidine kinase/ligand-binding sensor domain-containing protein/DNA-binding response OmpR family regulator